jgi:hypothetical protein
MKKLPAIGSTAGEFFAGKRRYFDCYKGIFESIWVISPMCTKKGDWDNPPKVARKL